jgi:hypothetical protein
MHGERICTEGIELVAIDGVLELSHWREWEVFKLRNINITVYYVENHIKSFQYCLIF